MAGFVGALAIQDPDPSGHTWTLARDLGFGEVTVPAGFRTDGASIPRALWWLEPPWGRAAAAAVVHDRLYALRRAGTPHAAAMTRRQCDALFHAALLASGVPRPVAWLLWAAVRSFGRPFATLPHPAPPSAGLFISGGHHGR
jgi:hypothetical protein